MIIRDPGMREFVNLTQTCELAIAFARAHGLILTDLQLQTRGKLNFSLIQANTKTNYVNNKKLDLAKVDIFLVYLGTDVTKNKMDVSFMNSDPENPRGHIYRKNEIFKKVRTYMTLVPCLPSSKTTNLVEH